MDHSLLNSRAISCHVLAMSSRILPQELIDSIIDRLHDDAASLQSCALVSSAWRPSTRFHLFGSVSIRFCECSYPDNAPRGGTADTLYRILYHLRKSFNTLGLWRSEKDIHIQMRCPWPNKSLCLFSSACSPTCEAAP